jgi:hypothetical protein
MDSSKSGQQQQQQQKKAIKEGGRVFVCLFSPVLILLKGFGGSQNVQESSPAEICKGNCGNRAATFAAT